MCVDSRSIHTELIESVVYTEHQHNRCDNSWMILAILFSLKTVESLHNGVATNFQMTPLFSIRKVSLVSSQSCRSVDSDAWCKHLIDHRREISTGLKKSCYVVLTVALSLSGLGSSERPLVGTGGALLHQHEATHGAEVLVPHDPRRTPLQQGRTGKRELYFFLFVFFLY